MTLDQQIADTILNQLGGLSALRAMVSAKEVRTIESGLRFTIGTGAKKRISIIKITLNANDLYDLEFAKIHNLQYRIVSKMQNIFADDLIRIIEEEIGLFLSLNN